jgi:archaellum biogenesis ATPase FlaH
MPIDISNRIRQLEKSAPKRVAARGTSPHELFQEIPEGGNGAIKGRDHASVSLLGHLKNVGMDFDLALSILHMWNERFCKPPLDPAELSEKASRLWIDFTGKEETVSLQTENLLTFLDIPKMEEEAAKSASLGWVMEGGIPAGGLVYITAPPAFGKTWVVLDLLRACLTGTRWLGKYQVDKTPVMYLDEEMGVARVLPRIQKLQIPRNSDLLYTNRLSVKLDNKSHREQIIDAVRKYSIKIIVVDSLTRIHGLDEGSNRDMAKLYSYFREIMDAGATLVICHHDRKGGQGDSNVGHDRSRGAGEIMAAADMVYGVEKHDGVHRIVCTKSRLVAEEDAIQCDFVIEDSEDNNFVYVRAINHAEISNRTLDNCELSIVNFLRDVQFAKTADIKANVKFADAKVVAAINRLLENGEVLQETGDRNSKVFYLKPRELDDSLF